MKASLPQKAAAIAAGPRVISEGRFRISEEPGGALVVEYARDGGPPAAVTLPPIVAALIHQLAAGQKPDRAQIMRALSVAMRG